MQTETTSYRETDIAIVGMSCQAPGVHDLRSFWQVIVQGQETLTHFSPAQLDALGVPPEVYQAPNYVKSAAHLEHIDLFDADFFDISAKEATLMDPQHRLFMHHAWTALEDANVRWTETGLKAGVFAGTAVNSYLLHHWNALSPQLKTPGDWVNLLHQSSSEHMVTKVAYHFNLTGPCVNLQTACSTSLAAVHLAMQSLLMHECDIAVAGGASIFVPQSLGYPYEVGSICSKDGHCRPFSADASGTVFGSGVGVVVLKRLADALEDHDHIYAVIKASAMNNDGSNKMHFTAPSISGQQAVIEDALSLAEVSPDTIGYVETHGTGTLLGDPIEIKALTQAYQNHTPQQHYCKLGSTKANLGHLNAAAGVTGLIKAALVLQEKIIPPLANFNAPNPQLHLAQSPFTIPTVAEEWQTSAQHPHRAAVSSFGIGGSNVHLILEEAPKMQSTSSLQQSHLLVWSAKSSSRLQAYTQKLLVYLQETQADLADIAHTLQQSRSHFSQRRFIICHSIPEVIEKIRSQIFNHPSEDAPLLNDQALVWLHGQTVNWSSCYPHEQRQCVTVPSSVFESKSYWLSTNAFARPQMATAFEAPANEIEALITEVWSSALKISPIGIDDHFYELGGDSLLATQILTHIQAAYPIDLEPNVLDQHPTIRTLANHIDGAITELLNDSGEL